MPSTISAGTTAGTAIAIAGDTTGNLAFQTNGTTTALTLNTSQNATFVGSINSPNTFGFKNRIINGAMVIDQRYAGASVSMINQAYNLDRWQSWNSDQTKLTVQRNAGSVTPPAGFTNYLGITSTSAYSVGSGDYFAVRQQIEGYNVADLNFGSANAKTVTLSFWVRSSLTGTFGGVLENEFTRSYPFTYTISAANTWEYKTVTVAGDTSGSWNTTNGTGLVVIFSLGVGSTYSAAAGAWTNGTIIAPTGATSVVGTNGATFYITGVQLEVGSTATSFDVRPYGTELNLCLRYCEVWNDTSNNTFLSMLAPNPNNTFQLAGVFTCVQKRTLPTVTESSASTFTNIWLGGASTPSAVDFSAGSNKTINVNITSSTNQGSYVTRIYLNAGAVTSNYVIADAEL